MAKSAATSATVPSRFRVSLKGYPIMGFVEEVKGPKGAEIKIHSALPKADHFRPRDAATALDEGIDDGWLTAAQLEELYGIDPSEFEGKVDPKRWRKRRRVRMDLTGAMFRGCVIEAADEYQARAIFQSRYGVKNTSTDLWEISDTKEPEGPFEPKKLRGLLAQG